VLREAGVTVECNLVVCLQWLLLKGWEFLFPKVFSCSLGYKFPSIYSSKAPLLCCVWAVSSCLGHLGQSQILFLSVELAALILGLQLCVLPINKTPFILSAVGRGSNELKVLLSQGGVLIANSSTPQRFIKPDIKHPYCFNRKPGEN